MTLLEAEINSHVLVKKVDCGGGFSRNLASLGIHEGDRLSVIRKAPFQGPILVRVEGSEVEIAVGRGMASRITVEPD
ncbi:MAG TPA: FeoA family protein [Myxococcota bacterium]|nr:FeoA family protein [Myxococcota bacterium]HPB51738.1 FeoA family protein [Myxococcota bacterium]